MDHAESHRSGTTAAPLPSFDTDPLLCELTAAQIMLERGRASALAAASSSNANALVELRLLAIDVEAAGAKVASAIQRRRSEL